jgi:uncharacterized protein
VLGAGSTAVVALAAAYVIALVATPAGISGAVLLPPFQAGVLGVPSLAIAPTNLLYNVVATPGALYRYWRQGQAGGRLALVLIAGGLPGVIAGSVIRVELLPGEGVFDVVVAVVLIPMGSWLALTRPPAADMPAGPARVIPVPVLVVLAVVVGCVGGIYGIGGGAILAPVLIGSGRGSCRAGLHVRDLGCGRDHVHAVVPVSPGRVGSGLACWPRAGCRGPGGRLYRCAYPVADA